MRKFFALLLTLAVLGFALAGCSSEEPKEAAETTPAEKAEPATESDAESDAATAAEEAAGQIQVGFVYVSPIGDAGWSYAHDMGRQAVEAMDGVTTSYVEAVPEGPDAERVIANMARKGYKVIFTTSFGYMDPTIKVAKEYPDTVFMHCSGFKSSENVGNYFGRMYQARYLSGVVAGHMTKTKQIGYAAAFPIPEVIRGINAFTLGVRSVVPDAEVRVVWTKTWYDPATEKEAAKSLLDVGCDIIAQHQDSPGPQEAAEQKGVYSIGYNTDMSGFAPKAHLTAPIWNWGPYYVGVVKSVMDGTWKSGSVWPGLREGAVDLSPFGPMVPQDVQDKVEDLKTKLAAGQFKVFDGPVLDQKGEVKVAKGSTATDEQMLGMTWFVEGVIGSTE